MRKLIILCIALMMIALMPAAMAITVDGHKSPGEWNDNWAFGQTNNATAAAQYDIYNTGDALEIRQGAFGHDTSIWYATDPKNDSYNSATGNFDQTMAQLGESSGSDLKSIYGYYDPTTDTYYGLCSVYGIPGDLDANGNIGTNCDNFGDCLGDPDGPVDSGLGPDEVWRIKISQQGASTVEIRCLDNNWTIFSGPLDYNDVVAKMDPSEAGVYEIAVNNVSELWNISPCAPDLKVEVQSGGIIDGPGEDYATAFVHIPCPEIDIEKYVQDINGNWLDADNPRGPELVNGTTADWKYVVTNTGDEPLENIVVTDDILGLITCPPTTLDVGESTTCFKSDSIPDDCPDYENWATVEGDGVVSGITVTDEDPAHYYCRPDVPALTPAGLMALIGILGMIGIVGLKRRD